MGRKYRPRMAYTYHDPPAEKKCKDCGQTFPRTPEYFHGKFVKRKFTPERIFRVATPRCKPCQRAVWRKEQAAKSKKEVATYNQAWRAKTRQKARMQAWTYLAEKGCIDCGERDPRALQFDHINPDNKKADIARLLTKGFTWNAPTVQKELTKCVVRCMRCHAKRTAKQFNYYDSDELREHIEKLGEEYGFDV